MALGTVLPAVGGLLVAFLLYAFLFIGRREKGLPPGMYKLALQITRIDQANAVVTRSAYGPSHRKSPPNPDQRVVLGLHRVVEEIRWHLLSEARPGNSHSAHVTKPGQAAA